MWCVSIPSLALGIFTWIFVRYWASFVTNRQLLSDFFKFYCLVETLLFGFTIWLAIVLFYTFKGVTDWGVIILSNPIITFFVLT